MQAQGFGRKGAVAGGNALREGLPPTNGAFRPQAAPAPAANDAYAAQRAAFLAQERANGGFNFATEVEADGTAAWKTPTTGKTWDKSIVVAYVLWFMVGIVAAHRIYTGRYMSAAIQASLGIVAVGMMVVAGRHSGASIALPMFLAHGGWRLVDLFLIPGMCRKPPGAA